MTDRDYGPAGKPDSISYGSVTADSGVFVACTVSGGMKMTGIQSINTGTALPTTSRLFYSGTNDGTLFMPNIALTGVGHEIVVRAGNRFVLYPCGTQTIQTAASLAVNAKDSLLFHSNGTDWFILAWYRTP